MNSSIDKQPSPPNLSHLQAVLKRYYGYDSFRSSQAEIIQHVLAGRHAMVVMPTGGGKSLCYQIPALVDHSNDQQHPDLVLVLSPLIALMQDQVDALQARGIAAALINSSLDRETRLAREQELREGHYRLLYVTPERFRKTAFRDAIASRNITLLAIDEAHCVSQWGHDFRPDYSRIAEIREVLGKPTTIALTATATAECRRDIYRQLGLSADEIQLFHEGIDRPNLGLDVEQVIDEDEKREHLIESLRQVAATAGESASVIVYFSLIKTLERFSDHLRSRGFEHAVYHGDLSRAQRRQMQNDFMQGRTAVVLATPAFGMGVDKEDIRLIVHCETPGSIESYYQEIGRAGRDGLPSRCLWLYDQADLMTQMQFIEWSNPDAAFYDRLMHLLTTQGERCEALGLGWLNSQLQRVSPHDHRMETAIAMLDRRGVIAGPRPPECFQVIGELPDSLRDDNVLGEKRRRDQQRLYQLVQFAACDPAERQAFLNDYFLSD